MSDYATKKDVQDIVNKAFGELAELIGEFATNVDQKFQEVDQRFEQVDQNLDTLGVNVTRLDSYMNKTNIRLAKIERKLSSMDDKLEALENDIKEIYKLLNKKQDKARNTKGLKGKDLELYIIDTHKFILKIAKESNITLPKY